MRGIHHRSDVVGALLEGGGMDVSIRQPRAALVEPIKRLNELESLDEGAAACPVNVKI
jgi:hypothetical protein